MYFLYPACVQSRASTTQNSLERCAIAGGRYAAFLLLFQYSGMVWSQSYMLYVSDGCGGVRAGGGDVNYYIDSVPLQYGSKGDLSRLHTQFTNAHILSRCCVMWDILTCTYVHLRTHSTHYSHALAPTTLFVLARSQRARGGA